MPIVIVVIFCIGLLCVPPKYLPPFLQIFRQGLVMSLRILTPIAILFFLIVAIFTGYEKYKKYVSKKDWKTYIDSLDNAENQQAIRDSIDLVEKAKELAF